MRWKSKTWLDHFGEELADDIKITDVDQFRDKREQQVAPSTVRKDLVSLSTLFSWAVVRGLVASNPAESAKVTRPPEPRHRTGYLSDADEKALVAAAPSWLKPIIEWGINTGMDRSEILALSWRDVDRKAGVVYAPRSKTGAPREIPINSTLEKILKEAQRFSRVFLDAEGKPAQMEAANSALKRAYKKAEIRVPPWKILRHTFGSRLAMAGVSAVAIARLMGHRTQAITDRYMHLSPAHLRDAMKHLDGSIEAANAPEQSKPAQAGKAK